MSAEMKFGVTNDEAVWSKTLACSSERIKEKKEKKKKFGLFGIGNGGFADKHDLLVSFYLKDQNFVVKMTEKDLTLEDLDETVKQTDEQLNMMEWKMDNVEKELVEPVDAQDMCVMNLLKSVSEVRSDYMQLRRELVEVQALQRELSSRLRAQLRLVHGKFARLRQRLATAAESPAHR